MADFEDFEKTASELNHEIERRFIAMNLDWRNEPRLRELAREALTYHFATRVLPPDPVKQEIFGLIGLMLKAMEEAAQTGHVVPGSDCWKALARALWAEKEADLADLEARR